MPSSSKRYRLTEVGLAKLRAAVYRRDDFMCQMCGATVIADDERNELHTDYTGVGEVMVSRISKRTGLTIGPWILTLDHIVRLADGGHPNSPTNIRAACAPCNSGRKYSPDDALLTMPDIDWRQVEPPLRVKNRLFELERDQRARFQAAILKNADFSCSSCGRVPDHETLVKLHEGYDGSYPVNVEVNDDTSVMLIVRRDPGSDGLDPLSYAAVCTLCSLGYAV